MSLDEPQNCPVSKFGFGNEQGQDERKSDTELLFFQIKKKKKLLGILHGVEMLEAMSFRPSDGWWVRRAGG